MGGNRCIITGDFNLDMHDLNATYDLSLLLSKFGFVFNLDKNAITRPESNTCIDHVWTNFTEDTISVVVNPPITDHTLIVTHFRSSCSTINKSISNILLRKYSGKHKINFISQVKQYCDNKINFKNDLEKSCSDFLYTLSAMFTKHIPLKKKIIRKPYISNYILNVINEKNKLYNIYKLTKNQLDYANFKKTCNYLRTLISKSKKKYIINKLNKNLENPKLL